MPPGSLEPQVAIALTEEQHPKSESENQSTKMFKFTALCVMAVLACAAARPGLVSPLAYSASPYVAAPYAAQIGYNAPVVAPYASSYNAHQIDHSVAYPTLQYAVAPAAYAAAPAAYAAQAAYAAPAAYAAQAAYAAPAAYAAQAAYAAPAYAQTLLK